MSFVNYSVLSESFNQEKNNHIEDSRYKKRIEQTYFLSSLKESTEMKESHRKSSRSLYKVIKESDSEDFTNIKQEFVSYFRNFQNEITSFDFKMNTIYDKFASTLKTKLSNIDINSLLSAFKLEDEFFFDRYNFTYLTNYNIPKNEDFTNFYDYYDILKNTLTNMTTLSASQKIEQLNNLQTSMSSQMTDKWYDQYRSNIIGGDDIISLADYSEYLFNLFRSSGNMENNALINTSYLKTIYKNISNTSQYEEEMKVIKNNICAEYNKIAKNFNNIIYIISSNSISGEELNIGNYEVGDSLIQSTCLVLKSLTDQLSNMLSIHLMAFCSKLDAIIDYFDQSNKILEITKLRVCTDTDNMYIQPEYEDDVPYEKMFSDNMENYYEESYMAEQDDYIYEDASFSTRAFDYSVFLLEEIYEQDSMNQYIDSLLESTYLLEGTKPNNILESTKKFISTIIQKVSEVVGKWMSKVNSFIRSDNGFLTKYKDIILRHPLAKTKLENFYNYDIQKLLNIKVPVLNYQSMKDTLDSKEEFINSKFGSYIQDKDASLKDNIINSIKGKPITIENTVAEDGKRINRTDMFNFLLSFDKLKDSISQDQKEFENAQTVAENNLSTIEAAMKVEQQKKEQEEKQIEKDKQSEQHESSNYYDPMAQYFNEVEIGKNDTPSSDVKDNANPSDMNSNVSGSSDSNNKNNMVGNYASGAAADNEDAKKITDRIKNYYSVCAEVLSAKLELTNQIHTDYMTIIKWHVGNFNNKAGKDAKNQQAADTATTYKNNDNNDSSDNSKENKQRPKEEKTEKSKKRFNPFSRKNK